MKSIIELLNSMETLLKSVQEDFWSKKIEDFLKKYNDTGDIDIKEIESWYGGMGSINDLIVSRYNDHKIDENNEKAVNDELNILRKRIYKKLELLKHQI